MPDRSNQEHPTPFFADFPRPDLEDWLREVTRLLKGAPFEKRLVTRSLEGFDLGPLYTAADIAHPDGMDIPPGQAPFARGTRPLGHRQRPWQVAQELPHPDPAGFNRALRRALERGQTAVSLRLEWEARRCRAGDLPGGAEDDPPGGGTTIATLDDLDAALDGVALDALPIHLDTGAAFLPAAALLAALCRRRGVDPVRLSGSLGADPIALVLDRRLGGALPPGGYDALALLVRWGLAEAPGLRTLPVCGHVYHEGGASAVQELAFSLAAALEHLRALEDRGCAVEDLLPRVRFAFSIGTDFFVEIARLRAARRLWSRVVEGCGVDPLAAPMEIHAATSRRQLTVFDPHVNILRGTTAAMAAILGGCDSLHVEPFDAARGPGSELATRLARNTQLILREESHLDLVVDPAGGSWCVETLTDEVARAAWSLLQEVEAAGGMRAALRDGLPQRLIVGTAGARRDRQSDRREVLVGVNRYPLAGEDPADRSRPAVAARADRGARPSRAAATHAAAAAVDELAALGALGPDVPVSLFAHAVAAAEKGASIAELTAALPTDRDLSVPPETIPSRAAGAEIQELRLRVLAWRRGRDQGPEVLLANIGPVAGYMPRLDFTRTLFEIAGLRVDADRWFADGAEAAAHLAREHHPVVCLVGPDDAYGEAVPSFTAAIADSPRPPVVLVAGQPGDEDTARRWREAGVRDWIHLRTDATALLRELAGELGVGA